MIDSLDHEETAQENLLTTAKFFLFGITGLAFLLGIFVLLPMFLTYLSEGDARPPSQIHHADPAGKSQKTVYIPATKN